MYIYEFLSYKILSAESTYIPNCRGIGALCAFCEVNNDKTRDKREADKV